MYLQNLVNYTAAHSATMLLTAIILILILMIILLYVLIRLSGMESRYRALMRGSKHPDLEGMLLQHIKEVEVVGEPPDHRGEQAHPQVFAADDGAHVRAAVSRL